MTSPLDIVLLKKASDPLATYLDQPKYFGRKGSPVKGMDLISAAQEQGIDPRLLASIVANESGWGSHPNATGANNFSGMMGKGNTLFRYPTPRAGLDAAASLLKRRYISKGLDTPEKIGPVYAPTVGATNDPRGINNNWVNTVSGIYKRLPAAAPITTPTSVAPAISPVKGTVKPFGDPMVSGGKVVTPLQVKGAPPPDATIVPSLPKQATLTFKEWVARTRGGTAPASKPLGQNARLVGFTPEKRS